MSVYGRDGDREVTCLEPVQRVVAQAAAPSTLGYRNNVGENDIFPIPYIAIKEL